MPGSRLYSPAGIGTSSSFFSLEDRWCLTEVHFVSFVHTHPCTHTLTQVPIYHTVDTGL